MHLILPGVGIAPDHSHWIACRRQFLLAESDALVPDGQNTSAPEALSGIADPRDPRAAEEAGEAFVATEEGAGAIISSGTRYVGADEAQLIKETGMVPNTNAAGVPKTIFFYTPEDPLTSASAAQEAYQLSSTPTHVVELDPSRIVNTYGGNVEGGSGIELTTKQPIPALRVTPLGP
jgi:hypothetical protein